MITEFQAFFTVFRQGKALTNSTLWKNRTIAANTLGAVLAAALAIAKGFGYGINIDEQTVTALAGGIAAVVCVANSLMHVATSEKIGLPPDGAPRPPADDPGPSAGPG